MGMSRYYAAAGIRKKQSDTDDMQEFPFLVIIGPSGNFTQVTGPSGVSNETGDLVYPYSLQAGELAFSHTPLAWHKNQIVLSLRAGSATVAKAYGFGWRPQAQNDVEKANDDNFLPEPNSSESAGRVIFDGHNWTQTIEDPRGLHYSHFSFLKIPGGAVHWVFNRSGGHNLAQGLFVGKEPTQYTDGEGDEGFVEQGGILGPRALDTSVIFVLGNAGGDAYDQVGIDYGYDADISDNICDMIHHKGTTYIAKQYAVGAVVPGAKGNWIMNDSTTASDEGIIDSGSDDVDDLYTSRDPATRQFDGTKSRSFAVHNDTVFLLSNGGKVHTVEPGGLIEVADLTVLGTPWSSGVFGGHIVKHPGGGSSWGGASSHRCKLMSFNGQLHAFLNFSTTFRVAKGVGGSTGKGIFWASSHDGVNWTDRSVLLPTSGIIPASGGTLVDWITQTNPYRFSGRNGDLGEIYASGFQNGSIGGPPVAGEDNVPCQPSGFRQTGFLPVWSSGNMVDTAGTTYDSLQVPLERGPASGQIFPTWIQYPAGFSVNASGDFTPNGVGPSGYDYTGCKNYHVAGTVDEYNDKMRVYFTEDNTGGTLLFEINRASGWTLKNHATETNQLNGFIPIDLYDPEVVVPSGGLNNPNPEIDPVNKTATLKYTLHDWYHWADVNVIKEYSIDGGINWHRVGTSKAKGTSTIQADPSGHLGQEHTWVWNYGEYISPNVFYKDVRMRLRAEV